MKTNLVRILALSAIAAAAGSAQQVDTAAARAQSERRGSPDRGHLGCGRHGSELPDGRAHPQRPFGADVSARRRILGNHQYRDARIEHRILVPPGRTALWRQLLLLPIQPGWELRVVCQGRQHHHASPDGSQFSGHGDHSGLRCEQQSPLHRLRDAIGETAVNSSLGRRRARQRALARQQGRPALRQSTLKAGYNFRGLTGRERI